MINRIKWYYPKNLNEAVSLLNRDKVILHSGGTAILRRDLQGIDEIIDLSQLPLRYTTIEKNIVEIGSMNTYSDVVSFLMKIDPENILVKSLSNSANTPLRNRITIGGSIAHFPVWSDLMGALIAMEVEIKLEGDSEGYYPIMEYIENKKLLRRTYIEGIRFQLSDWKSYHFRDVRTKSDYPAFNLTVLLKIVDNKILDCRIVIVGNVKKYKRLSEIEEYLSGKKISDVNLNGIGNALPVKFAGKRITDPEYTRYLAGVELERALQKLIQGK